jgi:hypothetical protein
VLLCELIFEIDNVNAAVTVASLAPAHDGCDDEFW